MVENEQKLVRCFAAVFPGLSADEIRIASADTVGEWNSLTAVTLVSVIEEEFGISIGMMDLAELDSFAAFDRYLAAKAARVE